MTPPPYEDRIVAFIDILGWSDLLRRSKTDSNELSKLTEIVRRLTFLSQKSQERREEFLNKNIAAMNTRFSYFSDTVVLSCPADVRECGWMTWEVQLLCSVLVLSGQYPRGAIVRGEIHHTESLLFGPALVDAYEIERQVAMYPRLVVTPEAAPFVVNPFKPDDTDAPTTMQWDIDIDGLRYLEIISRGETGKRKRYYNGQARRLRTVVAEHVRVASGISPKSPAQLKREAKAGWMLSYLDRVIAAEVIPGGLDEDGD